MSKKLNTTQMTNDLEQSKFFKSEATTPLTIKKEKVLNESMPVNPSINQPINQSTNRLMDKPKGFYINEDIDKRLDRAVNYYREQHGVEKVDRSTVLNAMLDNQDMWSDQSLDLLLGRLINQLTKRLFYRKK